MTQREQFIAWLGDAHALEVGIVSTLEKHIADAEGLPKLRALLKRHLAETKRHAKAVEQALAQMGGSHPVVREGISKLANLVAGLGTTLAQDTVVKNSIADFATEHFEIACYTSLVQTAELLGEKKIAAACQAILKEEHAMAEALEAEFPRVNAAYLATLDADEEPESEEPTPARKAAPAKSRAKAPAKKKAPARKKA